MSPSCADRAAFDFPPGRAARTYGLIFKQCQELQSPWRIMSAASAASVEQRCRICLAWGQLLSGCSFPRQTGIWGLHGFSKPPFSCLASLRMGLQREQGIKHADIALDGFCAKGDLPRPRSQGHVEPERKPGAKRTRSPSSSPSRIPTLLPPGPVCINYFHTSDLFKGLRFTNFRDFDLQMHRTPLHAKAICS